MVSSVDFKKAFDCEVVHYGLLTSLVIPAMIWACCDDECNLIAAGNELEVIPVACG